MQRVLVTGASGLLGSSICRHLQNNYDVMGTYYNNQIDFRDIQCIQANLLNLSKFKRLQGFNPDMIIHCAALTDVEECELDPDKAYEHNVEMTDNVLQLARNSGSSLIYISTDAVFDGRKGNYNERDKPNPINMYGRTKYQAEQIVRESTVSSIIVRTNIFGKNNLVQGNSLAEWMLSKIKKGETIPGFADAYFSPIFTIDLAEYIEGLFRSQFSGTLHVGTRGRHNKMEFAKILADVYGYDADIIPSSIDDMDFKAPRGKDLSLDISRAMEILNHELPTLERSIISMNEYYQR